MQEVYYKYGPAEFEGKGKNKFVKEHSDSFHSTLPSLLHEIPLPPAVVIPSTARADTQLALFPPAEESDAEIPNMNARPEIEGDLVVQFASQLGVENNLVIGACDPSTEAPYIRLDKHYWTSFRNVLPGRGQGAIAPLTIALTLLSLWFETARLANPTMEAGKIVLGQIGVRDRNPKQALNNCQWLRDRDGGVSINPAKRAIAIEVARAYLQGRRPEFE